DTLRDRALNGDRDALGSLLQRYRPRLRSLIDLRLSPTLRRRVSPDDVLQEVSLEALRDFPSYPESGVPTIYLWLRSITMSKLIDLQRHHLGVQARDARREISLDRSTALDASGEMIAARLLARWTTPSHVVSRGEQLSRLEKALNELDRIDREVVALRHFEALSNQEAAAVLKISPDATSKRHVRALLRLKKAFEA
ncbi:MAG: sigma-70 family RNA polymerase sigma factor, partial [Planctomycetota bacterium]